MDIQRVFAILTPYSVVVSLLYLFGFWSSFGVNVLEYIALTDVLKEALSPLLYSSLFVALGFVIGHVIAPKIIKITVVDDDTAKPVEPSKILIWLQALAWLVLAASMVHAVYFKAGNVRWYNVAFGLMCLLPIFVHRATFAESFIPQKRLRVTIVNVLVTVVLFSFGWGAVNAESLKNSNQQLIINGKVLAHRYVGWAGDFLFVWNAAENKIIAYSKASINTIERKVPEPEPIFSFSRNK